MVLLALTARELTTNSTSARFGRLPRPASRRTLAGSEDNPNGVSLLTRADEEVAELIRTYLPKFESTKEVVNAYKMTMSKELLSNLSIAVKAYLHEFLISRGHTFPPRMHVSNALESLLEEQCPQVPPLNQGNMAMPNPPTGVNANSGQDYRVAAQNAQLAQLPQCRRQHISDTTVCRLRSCES